MAKLRAIALNGETETVALRDRRQIQSKFSIFSVRPLALNQQFRCTCKDSIAKYSIGVELAALVGVGRTDEREAERAISTATVRKSLFISFGNKGWAHTMNKKL